MSKEAIQKLEGEGKPEVVDKQLADKAKVVDVEEVGKAGVEGMNTD